jgi:predicted nucleic acid-binding protein
VSEIFHLVARFEGTADDKLTKAALRDTDRDLRALERRGLTIRVAPWRLAGEVKADGDISLADANVVALAAERDATLLVGADDNFDDSPLDIDLSRFRTDPA